MCIIDECDSPVRSIGLCAKHYAQDYRRKNAKPKAVRLCDVDECGREHSAQGYCDMHYQRYIRQPKRSADPVYRAKQRERLRALAASRREYESARNKAHRATPEGRAAHARRESERRARVAGLDFEVFSDETMLALYGSDCYLCFEPIDLAAPRSTRFAGWERGLHREHIVPIVKGGGTTLENCRPAHALCNLRKAGS